MICCTYTEGKLIRYNLDGEMDMVIEDDTNIFNPDVISAPDDIMFYDGSIVGLYDQGILIKFSVDQAVTTDDASLSMNVVLLGIAITWVVYQIKFNKGLKREENNCYEI